MLEPVPAPRVPFRDVSSNANKNGNVQASATHKRIGALKQQNGNMGGTFRKPQILGGNRVVLAESPMQKGIVGMHRSPVQGKTPLDMRRLAKKPLHQESSSQAASEEANSAAIDTYKLPDVPNVLSFSSISPPRPLVAGSPGAKLSDRRLEAPPFLLEALAVPEPDEAADTSAARNVASMAQEVCDALAEAVAESEEERVLREEREEQAKREQEEKERYWAEMRLAAEEKDRKRQEAKAKREKIAQMKRDEMMRQAEERQRQFEKGEKAKSAALSTVEESVTFTDVCDASDSPQVPHRFVSILQALSLLSHSPSPPPIWTAESLLQALQGPCESPVLSDMHSHLMQLSRRSYGIPVAAASGKASKGPAGWVREFMEWVREELGDTDPMMGDDDTKDRHYRELRFEERLELLHELCCSAVAGVSQDLPGDLLRCHPCGFDRMGSAYWHVEAPSTPLVWVFREDPVNEQFCPPSRDSSPAVFPSQPSDVSTDGTDASDSPSHIQATEPSSASSCSSANPCLQASSSSNQGSPRNTADTAFATLAASETTGFPDKLEDDSATSDVCHQDEARQAEAPLHLQQPPDAPAMRRVCSDLKGLAWLIKGLSGGEYDCETALAHYLSLRVFVPAQAFGVSEERKSCLRAGRGKRAQRD